MRFIVCVAALSAATWFVVDRAAVQQVTVTTPMHSVSDGFFERTGVHWGFNWKGLHASFGGPNMAVPPFGGFDPSAGLHSGFAVRRPGFNGFMNFAAGQGYRQSFVTQAPSVTLFNGQPGYISDMSISPFVIGQIPVVGGFSTAPYGGVIPQPIFSTSLPAGVLPVVDPRNPRVRAMQEQLARTGGAAAVPHRPNGPNLQPLGPAGAAMRPEAARRDPPAAQASSAARAVPGVEEARRLHQAEKTAGNNEAMVLFERGRTAEEDGKPNVARIYYRMAAERATGPLRGLARARLDALSSLGDP